MKKITQKREDGSLRVQTQFEKPTRTQQHMAEACDINRIMARYMKNTRDMHLQKLPDPVGAYADLSDLGDFQENMNKVAHATYLFNLLPSKLREELKNDPGQLEPWLADPDNTQRAIKMGLMKPKPVIENAEIKSAKKDDKPEPKPEPKS